MKFLHPTRPPRTRSGRRGVVAVMLTLAMVLLVGAFSISVSRRTADERTNEHHHRSIAILSSAIDTAAEIELEPPTKLRLPVNQVSQQWVIVESVDPRGAQPYYLATLYHRDQPGMSVRRPRRSDP